jgi:sec-independent protein translocase protein TatA
MGIGIKELLVILIIIVLLFGTKKLKNIGTDLGAAIKGFRKSVTEEDDKQASSALENPNAAGTTIDGKAEKIDEKK